VPDCARVLFHVCETDSPTGKSNSSLQSVSGTVLELVMVKWAMKPVCHVCHRQRRRGRSRMSYGGDGESEDGNYQCRHGYVKRCAPALHVIVQSDHSSQH